MESRKDILAVDKRDRLFLYLMTASDKGFRALSFGTESGWRSLFSHCSSAVQDSRHQHPVPPMDVSVTVCLRHAYLLQAPEMGDQLSAEMFSIHLPLIH
jgi:hypothetical protein